VNGCACATGQAHADGQADNASTAGGTDPAHTCTTDLASATAAGARGDQHRFRVCHNNPAG
ncbi:MAG TPA: hypothetical protein PKV27_11940, partial [Ilumatobacteraceae bacterium]|nr:hypothetical protein [Ilumatobacteraceae bacterium]